MLILNAVGLQIRPSGKYRVGLHNSSHGGGKTMHINFNNREKLYKIRSK